MTRYKFLQSLVAAYLLSCSLVTFASESIKVGMTAALSGSSAALGNNLRNRIESYFKLVNDAGGVQNRLLEFRVLDDGYEPERAAHNMRTLIDGGVDAVLGNVGTPTAIVTVPIAKSKKTLLFGAFSGGDVLRSTPANRYIINYRPSYAEETQEIINGLLQVGIKPDEIAFFSQRDGFGDAAYQGAINALQRHGFSRVSTLVHGRYTRNSLNVEGAVASILDASTMPKAIIMAGSYAPSAKFINLLQSELPDIWFMNLSFASTYSLKAELGAVSDRVVVAQVVPQLNSSLPIINEFTDALDKLNDKLIPNEVSLEGFIIAKIFHKGLENIEGDINKESIIDGLESLKNKDIGLNVSINFSEEAHQAMHQIWLTRIQQGEVKPFSWKMMYEENKSVTKHE